MEIIRFNNTVVLTDRLERHKNSSPFTIPPNTTLIVTDIVVQNRAPGDAPVDPAAFTRMILTNMADNITLPLFFTIVGNNTLNMHFHTGIPILKTQGIQPPQHLLQVQNAANSTAPFIQYLITGLLVSPEA